MPYPSDLNDEQWDLLQPVFNAPGKRGHKHGDDLRTVVNAKTMLATTKPRDIAGKTRRRMAAEEIADLVALDAKLKKIKAELKAAVTERGSTSMDIYGIGPARAARPWPMSATWPGLLIATGSRPGPGPHPWTPHRVSRTATDSHVLGTGG